MSDFDDDSKDIKLIPKKRYLPIVKDAFVRLPTVDDQPNDLMQMLFSREELEWLDSQRTSH